MRVPLLKCSSIRRIRTTQLACRGSRITEHGPENQRDVKTIETRFIGLDVAQPFASSTMSVELTNCQAERQARNAVTMAANILYAHPLPQRQRRCCASECNRNQKNSRYYTVLCSVTLLATVGNQSLLVASSWIPQPFVALTPQVAQPF